MDKKDIVKFADMVPGKSYEQPVLVVSMEERTAKNGKTFVTFNLSDGDKTIQASYFEKGIADMELSGVKKGAISNVNIVYREPFYNLTDIYSNEDPEVAVEDFIRTVPVNVDDLYDEIISIVQETNIDPPNEGTLADIALEILWYYEKEFKSSSAAKTIHHNIKGGLIYHSARMVMAAKRMCEVYTSLDRQLLICGAALHDIGKLTELSTDEFGEAEYTVDGRLFGHSMLGAKLVYDYGLLLSCPQERVKLLMHLLASHHGKLEYGAITVPAVPEAACLHAIDMMDSRIYQFEEAYRNMDSGELSKKIYGLENSTVFKA